MQSVQEDREAFRSTHDGAVDSEDLRRPEDHWSNLSDTVRAGLRKTGFFPASPPEGDVGFRLADLGGDLHRLRDYRGRWVLINFWATWCPPCRMEMPSMQDLWERLPEERFVLLAVNLQEDPGRVRTFADRYGLTFPVLLDEEGTVSRRFRVRGVPETWLVDPSGTPRAKLNGPHRWNTRPTRNLLRELLDLRGG